MPSILVFAPESSFSYKQRNLVSQRNIWDCTKIWLKAIRNTSLYSTWDFLPLRVESRMKWCGCQLCLDRQDADPCPLLDPGTSQWSYGRVGTAVPSMYAYHSSWGISRGMWFVSLFPFQHPKTFNHQAPLSWVRVIYSRLLQNKMMHLNWVST